MQTRLEHDFLGELVIPNDVYYGVQTCRALENFNISNDKIRDFPEFVIAFAQVKKAAALTNAELELLPQELLAPICQACDEIIEGKLHDQFPLDCIQGGAGTSVNMNANEVIANRALEIMGYKKGEYQYCHPNNHINCSQSTNDAYPTSLRIALFTKLMKLSEAVDYLSEGLGKKSEEFSHVIKMGRTQLQDAVPMTLGMEFGAYAKTVKEEIPRIAISANLLLEVNMGATAIGTGINAPLGYAELCVENLAKITGYNIELSNNLIEATWDTGDFVLVSAHLKRIATKVSKICNDLRLLSSGPRCGINEINLPQLQPGSSIMPGKVNPVIPEVVNQVCFDIIGKDLTVALASEAGQLELNVMEPIIAIALFNGVERLSKALITLQDKCVKGITANEEHCRSLVQNSIGIVTALTPYIGYENSASIAREALEKNASVYELVLEKKLLSKENLDTILSPEYMLHPHKKLDL